MPFMEPVDSELSNQLLTALTVRGVANSHALQAALNRSQPTLSRLLAGLASKLLVLGTGKRTRYALPHLARPRRAPTGTPWPTPPRRRARPAARPVASRPDS